MSQVWFVEDDLRQLTGHLLSQYLPVKLSGQVEQEPSNKHVLFRQFGHVRLQWSPKKPNLHSEQFKPLKFDEHPCEHVPLFL